MADILTLDLLNRITGSAKYAVRKQAYLDRLKAFSGDLTAPHVFAQVAAQVLHESMGFRYVEEIASGAAYEGREDLGNTEPGDGVRFKGRDMIQCTGRFNYGELSKWASVTVGSPVDFVRSPGLLTKPKWLGISVVWYFLTRPALMDACRNGDIKTVTRIVNGGLNGYDDRKNWYDKTAMALLGVDTVREVQSLLGVAVDGVSGPNTRAAMHDALKRMSRELEQAPTPAIKPNPFVALISAILSLFKKG